jgi:phosphoribosylanthranilate isomerase
LTDVPDRKRWASRQRHNGKMERFIKICGITSPDDARWAADCGAGAIGMIFAAESPRRISLAMAEQIVSVLPRRGGVLGVGVFVNEPVELVNQYIRRLGLDYVQLHGEESPDYCQAVDGKFIKAVRMADREALDELRKYDADAFLLDTFCSGKRGGTGKTFDWSLAVRAKDCGVPIILSGGLNPENVIEAIETVSPAGVDASSGVESSAGKKHPEKVRVFVQRAMRAFEKLTNADRRFRLEKER